MPTASSAESRLEKVEALTLSANAKKSLTRSRLVAKEKKKNLKTTTRKSKRKWKERLNYTKSMCYKIYP
jgi:hypothetical protein